MTGYAFHAGEVRSMSPLQGGWMLDFPGLGAHTFQRYVPIAHSVPVGAGMAEAFYCTPEGVLLCVEPFSDGDPESILRDRAAVMAGWSILDLDALCMEAAGGAVIDAMVERGWLSREDTGPFTRTVEEAIQYGDFYYVLIPEEEGGEDGG